MATADGSITFNTSLDNSDLEKQLKRAERRIDDLKRKIEGQEDKKTLIEKQMERSDAAIAKTVSQIEALEKRLSELRGVAETDPSYGAAQAEAASVEAQLKAAESTYTKQANAYDALKEKWNQANDVLELYRQKLADAEGRQAELGSAAQQAASKSSGAFSRAAEGIRARLASAAVSARQAMSNAAQQAASPWENFGKRVNTMLKKVFVFGMVLKGIRAVKSAIGDMLAENQVFQSSVANLKATMGGFLSSMVQVVLPVLIKVVNALSGVFQRVAGFIDSVFGTNIVGSIQAQKQQASDAVAQANAQKRAEYEAQVAKAQEKQANAAGKLAKKQKEANRQLMAFDEINAMTAESSEDATDAVEDYMEGIEQPTYEADPFQFGDFADTGMLQGVLDWLDRIRDRILNDFEGPFARIREGLGLIKKGWDEVVDGIKTGNWKLVWQGVGDIVIGALYSIEGAFGGFMDWLDELTGYRFHGMFEGLKQTMHGVVEFIEGVLRGDWALAFQGLHDIANGAVSAIENLLDGLLIWLDEVTGGRFHNTIEIIRTTVDNVLEDVRRILNGAIEFVEGVFTGDLDRAIGGLREIIGGVTDVVRHVVDGAIDFAKKGVSGLFDWLSEKFPELKPIFETAKQAFVTVLDAMGDVLHGTIESVRLAIEGALDIIVGIFTLDGDRIMQGFGKIGDAARAAFEGIVNAAGRILGALSDWFHDNVTQPINNALDDAWRNAQAGAANAWNGIKNAFSNVAGFFARIFGDAWAAVKNAFNGGGQIFNGVVNAITNAFKDLANKLIDGLNWAIAQPFEGINGIIRSLNGWNINGFYPFSFWEVPVPSIPYLAGGAVIPPNREFLAVLGDQKRGTNVEAPADLIRQIVREETGKELASSLAMAMMQVLPMIQSGQEGDANLVLYVDGEELARAVNRGNASLARRGAVKPEIAFG